MSNYSPKDEINLAFVALCKSGDTYGILESLYHQAVTDVINFISKEYVRDFAYDYREDLILSLREKFEKT